MSTPRLSSAEGATGAEEANGARLRTVKQPPSGSSVHKAAARTTKKAAIKKLLRRKRGATLTALQEATGWKPHSLRAALTGLRKSGLEIQRSTNAKGQSVYRAVGA